jgi:hypothetical protein
VFDAQLRRTDPDWGVRDLGVVESVADQNDLALEEVFEIQLTTSPSSSAAPELFDRSAHI